MGVFVDVEKPFADPADQKPGETMLVLPFDAAALYINRTPARNLPLSPANDVRVYGLYAAARPICGIVKNAINLTAPVAGSYCIFELGNTNDEELPAWLTETRRDQSSFNQTKRVSDQLVTNRPAPLHRIPESMSDQLLKDLTIGPDVYAAGMTGGITIKNMMTSTPLVSIECTIAGVEMFASQPAGMSCEDQ